MRNKTRKMEYSIIILVLLWMMCLNSMAQNCCSNYTSGTTNDSLTLPYLTCSICNNGCYRKYTTYVYDINGSSVSIYQCALCSNYCLMCTNINSCSTCDTVNGYYKNASNLCQNCNQLYGVNCTSCNQTECITCANETYLDFSADSKACVVCNLYKCLECQDGPKCMKCQDTYYLNTINFMCMPCYFPCITCKTSATSCQSCPQNLYYLNQTTKECKLCQNSLTITNCSQCNNEGSQCQKCISTLFYITQPGKLCQLCINNCKHCHNQTHCISCKDYTYALVPYNMSCELCNVVMNRCMTCLSSTVCTQCENATYFLTYPPKQCLTCHQARLNCKVCQNLALVGPICTQCSDKYYLFEYQCLDCPNACAICTSLTECSSCINDYYALQNQICQICNQLIDNCLKCSDYNTCIMCTNRTIPNPNLNGTCVKCGQTQYPNQIDQKCYPCVAPCQACFDTSECITCKQPFYQLIQKNKKCKGICGDNVVMDDQCDNGIGIINDGCSDECKIQPNFTCQFHTDTDALTGQSVNRSICSYDLKVNISMLSIEKEPFENTMTWKYTIFPYLYGLPGTTSRTFNQDELKKTYLLQQIMLHSSTMGPVSAGTPGLVIESIQLNPQKSQVSLTLSYQKDIKNSQYQFLVNFTYLRSDLSIANFNTTKDSENLYAVSSYHFNSMIGQHYSQEQYSQAKIIYTISLAIALMSFLAFIVGIFSKQVAGLQMAMLCQFVYISLFYYQGTLQLPFFAFKTLLYSTGYNIPLASKNYLPTQNEPPQTLTLQYYTTTFVNNFNLMAIFYIIPLISVITFIPMKAKCIRKLSTIQIGHKWVDLLLGQINLFFVLFNFQYFLFSLTVYLRDGRNLNDYVSIMIICFATLSTVISFAGLVFKPQFYGNFRTVFRYNKQLITQVIQEKEKFMKGQQNLIKKFEGQSKCRSCLNSKQNLKIFINESYFWRKWRNLHTILTYNHYTILIIYFTSVTICITLLKSSQIIIICLSILVLMQLIIMRPYGQISQKLRAIYFSLVYIMSSVIRYINNQVLDGQYNILLGFMLLLLLIVALIWTYVSLISYFYNYITYQMSNRTVVVSKVFKNQTQNIDKQAKAEQEEVLMRKLMKRYERIQLQYNINDARNQLISGFDSFDENRKLVSQSPQIQPAQISQQNNQQKVEQVLPQQILKVAEQSKNYKGLKQTMERQKKKKKQMQMKSKVSGQKLLKLLRLDNFNKYEEEFLMSADLRNTKTTQEQSQLKNTQRKQKAIQKGKEEQSNQQDSSSEINKKDEYKSVQPHNLQEAHQKLQEERIIIQENQFIRYKRAMQIITKNGLDIDRQLIASNYDKI